MRVSPLPSSSRASPTRQLGVVVTYDYVPVGVRWLHCRAASILTALLVGVAATPVHVNFHNVPSPSSLVFSGNCRATQSTAAFLRDARFCRNRVERALDIIVAAASSPPGDRQSGCLRPPPPCIALVDAHQKRLGPAAVRHSDRGVRRGDRPLDLTGTARPAVFNGGRDSRRIYGTGKRRAS